MAAAAVTPIAACTRRLAGTTLDQIRLDGTRGGAGLVAAAVNALLSQAAS